MPSGCSLGSISHIYAFFWLFGIYVWLLSWRIKGRCLLRVPNRLALLRDLLHVDWRLGTRREKNRKMFDEVSVFYNNGTREIKRVVSIENFSGNVTESQVAGGMRSKSDAIDSDKWYISRREHPLNICRVGSPKYEQLLNELCVNWSQSWGRVMKYYCSNDNGQTYPRFRRAGGRGACGPPCLREDSHTQSWEIVSY